MYLIITEDGEIYATDIINIYQKEYCDNGSIEIINISDPMKPRQWCGDSWIEIDHIKGIDG